MKARKKPVVIEFYQWFGNGDHPKDGPAFELPDQFEGKLIRYFRHPHVSGENVHDMCGRKWNDHGWIDTLEGGHAVCPGDCIITGVSDEYYPCKPDIFALTYDILPVDGPFEFSMPEIYRLRLEKRLASERRDSSEATNGETGGLSG
jgi:hypothetical protein